MPFVGRPGAVPSGVAGELPRSRASAHLVGVAEWSLMTSPLLRLLPLALLSRLVGWVARQRLWRRVRLPLLRLYARHYRVDLGEAESALDAYPTFEAFFTRRLRLGSRPVAEAPLVSPCDGRVGPPVEITAGAAITAKGHPYRLDGLLGPLSHWAGRLHGGRWLTLYLSPRDYHRYHAPAAMAVVESCRIVGRRWPVNGWGIDHIPDLFVENERVVVAAETPMGWPLVMVFVAALNVGRVELHGVCPPAGRAGHHRWELAAGEEMGYFSLGSTILLLLPPTAPPLLGRPGEAPIRVGEALASATPAGR